MNSYLFFCVIVAVTAGSNASRIIGGGNANIANHPYQASMRIAGPNGGHNCGAVLISNTQALTAAHCGGGPVETYSILAGTTDRTVVVCATCALRSPLRGFIRHVNASNSPAVGYHNDIAIANFYSIAHNVNIKYATLATEADGDFFGQQCILSGWGRQSPGGPMPTNLQEGSLAVLSNEDCADQWGANRIHPESLCAKDPVRAACGGDNGGPLVCNGVVAGIFSWNEANCSPAFASVFVRVSSYTEWINSQLLNEDDSETFSADDAINEGWGWR